MNRLAVIVVNWNGIEDTLLCLDSLLGQTYKALQVVVVDNGSTDNSKQLLEKKQSEVGEEKLVIIYKPSNIGFTGGVNTINYVLARDFDGIALFNNDATADKRWLEELADSLFKKPKTGIVTGLLLHEDGKTIDSTGDWYSIWGLPFPRSRNEPRKNAPKAGYVFSGSGGASLYRADMLEEIGIFDNHYFAYYEDIDISFRAQLAGWQVFYNPKAVAYHKQGATSGKMPGFTVYQTFKNLPMLFIKNVPIELLFRVGVRFWLAYLLMLGNAVRSGNMLPAMKGWLAGVWLVCTHAIWQRHYIQESKEVSTQYIEDLLWQDLPPDQTGIRKFRAFFSRKKK